MKAKYLYIGLFFSLFLTNAYFSFAQDNIPFDKDYFSDEQKKALKDAIKEIKKGDDYIDADIAVYSLALEHYLKANDFNPNNALLNYKIGKCYIKTIQKTNAIPYLELAETLNPDVRPDLLYLLGQGYHLNLDLDKAVDKYKEYKGTLSPFELAKVGDEVDKKIEECGVAKEMVNNPIRVFIDNMGPAINSEFPEYSPFITADEKVIMFTSSRDNTTGGKVDPLDLLYYEDIYRAVKEGEVWLSPKNPGKPLNTDNHDAIVGVSPDGKHALIYIGKDHGGDIYECDVKEDGTWKNPNRLPKEINTDYHETSASFSPDMNAIYFVSDKPEGYGGRDIYISELLTKEGKDKLKYDDAINLGAMINTPYDEEGVFMHPDGKTLYFSSKGHRSMGGYDIFYSVIEDGMWSAPVNIGYPVNTPDDDVFFSISMDGKHGYYSSFNPDGYGHRDLYVITFLGKEKPVTFKNDFDYLAHQVEPVKETVLAEKFVINDNQIAIIRGKIMDAVTLSPLGGVIVEIFDNELGMMVASFESNTRTGEYMVSLASGKNYGFGVKAKEYMFHSENLIIPSSTEIQEIFMDIYLNKVEIGAKIILQNIFFDFDKATLRLESAAELNRLTKLLNDVPTMKIEISGHTDNIGSNQYNKQLSSARAKSVVDYLINKGISSGRLTSVGYGETQPIASNETEKGRQINRRTEFKVLSK